MHYFAQIYPPMSFEPTQLGPPGFNPLLYDYQIRLCSAFAWSLTIFAVDGPYIKLLEPAKSSK